MHVLIKVHVYALVQWELNQIFPWIWIIIPLRLGGHTERVVDAVRARHRHSAEHTSSTIFFGNQHQRPRRRQAIWVYYIVFRRWCCLGIKSHRKLLTKNGVNGVADDGVLPPHQRRCDTMQDAWLFCIWELRRDGQRVQCAHAFTDCLVLSVLIVK